MIDLEPNCLLFNNETFGSNKSEHSCSVSRGESDIGLNNVDSNNKKRSSYSHQQLYTSVIPVIITAAIISSIPLTLH
uniref:Uncharacterized protein n=1 Tax=Glossina palpalis gambiensis TaxID=67801 RepID=A0A1B0C0M0_9MUSC